MSLHRVSRRSVGKACGQGRVCGLPWHTPTSGVVLDHSTRHVAHEPSMHVCHSRFASYHNTSITCI